MRHAFTFVLASAASMALVGCNKAASVTEKPATSIPRTRNNAIVVGGWVIDSSRIGIGTATVDRTARAAAEPIILADDATGNPIEIATSTVDTTITLGAWLKSHPLDKVSAADSPDGHDETFCRTAAARLRLFGHSIVRSAVFYVPAPPRGEALPRDTAHIAEQLCELRTVWLTTEMPDSVTAHALADSLGGAIDARLGSHKPGAKLIAVGADDWKGWRTWTRPGTTVVLAVAPIEQKENWEQSKVAGAADSSRANPARRVVIAAYAPGSGLQDFDLMWARIQPERAEEAKTLYRNADSAMAWAALPAITKDLRTVLVYVRLMRDSADTLRSPQVDSALLRAVKATHDIAPSLSPPRHAAALLAADIVLFASVRWVNPDLPLNRSLTSIGITFDDLPIDHLLQNTRPWLWEAYRLDSLGRAGHAAFVELLSQGWTTRGACADGGEPYKRIIEHGEAALRRGDTDPLVHYYVGSAYRTIFDMANVGEHDEYIDAKQYKPQAESARLQAIEHYRSALATLTDRSTRRDAWNKSIKLLLRSSGGQPEHVCNDD